MEGNIVGPILFFVLWNIIRMAFIWYTQEFGYKLGTSITKDLSGGLMGKITEGASILGMFVIGGLVQRWVSISFAPVVSTVTQSEGAYIDWTAIQATADSSGVAQAIHDALSGFNSLGATGLEVEKVTTLQQNLDSLIPGLAAVGVTLLCCWLLKKKVSPDRHHHRHVCHRHRGSLRRPALGRARSTLGAAPPREVSQWHLVGPRPLACLASSSQGGGAAVAQSQNTTVDLTIPATMFTGFSVTGSMMVGGPRARVLQRAQRRGLHPDPLGTRSTTSTPRSCSAAA